MQPSERYEQLKDTIAANAPFGWRDYGHISRLECMQCENACAEAVEEIIEILESNPDFDPCLDELVDALYEGGKDELADRLAEYQA